MHDLRACLPNQSAKLSVHVTVPQQVLGRVQRSQLTYDIVVHRETDDLIAVRFQQACFRSEDLVLAPRLLIIIVQDEDAHRIELRHAQPPTHVIRESC